MTATTFIGHFLGPDTHANRPSASGLPNGTLYVCTTHAKIERVVSGAWVDYATLGSYTGVGSDPIFDAKGDLLAASAADTATRLPVGSNDQVLTVDSAQTLGVKWATPAAVAATALTLLSTTTLSSAGTIDVSGISGSYNDLVLVVIARFADAGVNERLNLRLNNDSGTSYYGERLTVNGATATATDMAGGNSLQCATHPAAGAALASAFGVSEITLYGYASTSWLKALQWHSVGTDAVTANHSAIQRGGGLWNSTAAITRVTLFGNTTANLLSGSQLRIYGRL